MLSLIKQAIKNRPQKTASEMRWPFILSAYSAAKAIAIVEPLPSIPDDDVSSGDSESDFRSIRCPFLHAKQLPLFSHVYFDLI